VRAWQGWSRISTYDNPEAWVRTVGFRLCLNRWRKAKNRIVAYRRHGADSAVGPPSEDTVAAPSGANAPTARSSSANAI
jgi:RNA polymerase sigma-70 factor (ECF subfamily)